MGSSSSAACASSARSLARVLLPDLAVQVTQQAGGGAAHSSYDGRSAQRLQVCARKALCCRSHAVYHPLRRVRVPPAHAKGDRTRRVTPVGPVSSCMGSVSCCCNALGAQTRVPISLSIPCSLQQMQRPAAIAGQASCLCSTCLKTGLQHGACMEQLGLACRLIAAPLHSPLQ